MSSNTGATESQSTNSRKKTKARKRGKVLFILDILGYLCYIDNTFKSHGRFYIMKTTAIYQNRIEDKRKEPWCDHKSSQDSSSHTRRIG